MLPWLAVAARKEMLTQGGREQASGSQLRQDAAQTPRPAGQIGAGVRHARWHAEVGEGGPGVDGRGRRVAFQQVRGNQQRRQRRGLAA